MWFDEQNKPDQPAKPNKQALLSLRATCLSHRGGVVSAEKREPLERQDVGVTEGQHAEQLR